METNCCWWRSLGRYWWIGHEREGEKERERLIAMASILIAMASNQIMMASNLTAMA